LSAAEGIDDKGTRTADFVAMRLELPEARQIASMKER